LSCSSSDDAGNVLTNTNLQDVLTGASFETGTVIACASSSSEENQAIVYFYPRPGVSNLRYFETDSINVDPVNFDNYTKVELGTQDLFNGYLKS
jgi:hypothetical protein